MLWKKVMPRTVGRPRAVGRDAPRRRPRTGADALRRGRVLGHPRHVRAGHVRGAARRAWTASAIAQGRDFAETGAPTSSRRPGARRGRREIAGRRTLRTRRSPSRRSTRSRTRGEPAAPFRTSTLQQEASRKLRFSSQTTMRVAQRLYENGHITYMRTDSVTLSDSALDAARAHAARVYGPETVPAEAATVRAGGRERAGGARGDPARRGRLPDAGRAPRRALSRRARPLRPRLQADASPRR